MVARSKTLNDALQVERCDESSERPTIELQFDFCGLAVRKLQPKRVEKGRTKTKKAKKKKKRGECIEPVEARVVADKPLDGWRNNGSMQNNVARRRPSNDEQNKKRKSDVHCRHLSRTARKCSMCVPITNAGLDLLVDEEDGSLA